MEDRLIKRGIGVKPRSSEAVDEVAELVGDGIVGSTNGEFIDMSLDSETTGGIGGLGQAVILGGNAVKPRLLLRIIGGTYLLRTFEEKVLEIMSNTRVGTILSPRLDDDSTKDFRLGMVFVEPYRQAVGEREGSQRRALGKKLSREDKKEEEIKLFHG